MIWLILGSSAAMTICVYGYVMLTAYINDLADQIAELSARREYRLKHPDSEPPGTC